MADLPFPITADNVSDLIRQMKLLMDDLYSGRIGGALLGDVLEIGTDDVLAIKLSSSGGLQKTTNQLAIKNKTDGGLTSTSDGEAVKCKTSGGLGSDVDGLYVLASMYSFGTIDCPAGTDPVADAGGDTLVLAGTGITITGDAATDTVTFSITDDAVTNAKLANMAVNTIKGRIAAGTGDPEDLTAANVRTIINVEDGADVTDSGNVGSSVHGSTPKTTPIDADTLAGIDSASSNVLTKFTWANIKSTLKAYFDGLFDTRTLVKVSDADRTNTALTTDRFIGFTSLSASRTYQISSEDIADASATKVRRFTIKDESGQAGTYAINITTEGAETIDGAASISINSNYGSVDLYSDGTNLFIT